MPVNPSAYLNLLQQAAGAVPQLGALNSSVPGTATGDASSALGIYGGLEQGGVRGDLRAASSAAQLAGKSGLAGDFAPQLRGFGQGLGGALNVYGGLQQGGVRGYGQALGGGLQLAGQLGGASGLLNSGAANALGTAGGYVAAPLAVYNAIANWQSGDTGMDAVRGAEAGAAVGSVVPVVGTIAGALIGGAVGALSSAFGGGKADPETMALEKYVPAFNKNPEIAGTLTPAQNFQLIAGVMDAKNNSPGHSTALEQVFGRMGENNFVSQMLQQVHGAVDAGHIHPEATPQQIYSQVVDPWLKTKGAQIKSDWTTVRGNKFGTALQQAVTNLIGQYQSGQLTGSTPIGVEGQTLQGSFTPYGAQAAQPPASRSAASAREGPRGRGNFNPHPVARGGYMDPDKLREIYKGSFQRFQEGGGADYLSYFTPTQIEYSPYTDTSGNWDTPSGPPANAPTDPLNLGSGNPQWNLSPDYTPPTTLPNSPGYGAPTSPVSALDPSQLEQTPGYTLPGLSNAGSFDPSQNFNPGALSGLLGGSSNPLGRAWSALTTGQQASTLGGLLAGLGGLQNNGRNMTQQYNPAPPPMFQNTGPRGTAQNAATGPNMYGNFTSTPRHQIDPGIANYATYGEGPTHQFFGSGAPPGPAPAIPPSAPPPPPPGGPGWGGHPMPVTPAPPGGQAAPVLGAGLSPMGNGLAPGETNPYGPAGGIRGEGNWMGPPGSNPYGVGPIPMSSPHPSTQAPTGPLLGPTPIGLGMPRSGGTPSPGQQTPPSSRTIQPINPLLGRRAIMARGGDSPLAGPRAHGLLEGPGDGTSDDIVPAALSSGEYVIPAHVVSALGNGDNKAGARALDAMQKNVRMKVGRTMIRNQHPTGKNRARRPEAYMRGGK